MSNAQQNAVVWNERTKWGRHHLGDGGPAGALRPRRAGLQPVQLGTGAENGYDFVGYVNPEYDRVGAGAAAGAGPHQAARRWCARRRTSSRTTSPTPTWSTPAAPPRSTRPCGTPDTIKVGGRHRHPQLLDLRRRHPADGQEGHGAELPCRDRLHQPGSHGRHRLLGDRPGVGQADPRQRWTASRCRGPAESFKWTSPPPWRSWCARACSSTTARRSRWTTCCIPSSCRRTRTRRRSSSRSCPTSPRSSRPGPRRSCSP